MHPIDDYLSLVSGVVHVGANLGHERDLYHQHDLNVLWVEPIPVIFNQLAKNIEGFDKQIAAHALITDVDGKRYDFKVANNYGGSSSIFDLKEHKEIWPEIDYIASIKLSSNTLDTLLAHENINPDVYDALVMDTQGSELLVLKGALNNIHRFKYIKTEVSDFEIYKDCYQLKDIEEFMSEHGYVEVTRAIIGQKAQPEEGICYDILYKKAE